MIAVGKDLAGAVTRPSGFCVLKGLKTKTRLVYTDDEILANALAALPQIVAIDAPLSLPEGRKSIEDKMGIHLRECDEELLRKKIKFFPITLGPMRRLTTRGIDLKRLLELRSLPAIEVYPGGAQDVLGIPRKQQGLDKLKAGLECLGIEGLSNRMSDHELDAVTCAFVGKLFLEGKSVTYGSAERGIVMPEDKRMIFLE